MIIPSSCQLFATVLLSTGDIFSSLTSSLLLEAVQPLGTFSDYRAVIIQGSNSVRFVLYATSLITYPSRFFIGVLHKKY